VDPLDPPAAVIGISAREPRLAEAAEEVVDGMTFRGRDSTARRFLRMVEAVPDSVAEVVVEEDLGAEVISEAIGRDLGDDRQQRQLGFATR